MRVSSSLLALISLATIGAYAATATTTTPAAAPATSATTTTTVTPADSSPTLPSPSLNGTSDTAAPAASPSTSTTQSTTTTTPAATTTVTPAATTTTPITTTTPAASTSTSTASTTTGATSVTPANATDISGRYRCEGNDYTGKSPYTSPAIVNKSGETYSFQWLNANGYPYNLGTGIYNKNSASMMAVVYWDPKKPDQFGTLIYQIQADGSLSGNWVYQSSNQVGSETCTKMK